MNNSVADRRTSTFLIASSEALDKLPLLGGKARSLALLAQSNVPIPPWFVVTPAAFEGCLTDGQREVWQGGGDRTSILSSVAWPGAWDGALQQAILCICPGGERVAVRSSALDEDGEAQSFAGQLESFLQVGPETVGEKIVEVWRSGFSDRLLAYRREHGLSDWPQPPAVLVQRMVQAQWAGVAFSADPVTGRRGVAVISAVRGLGDALVSGEADAETWQVGREGKILQHQGLPNDQPVLTEVQAQAIATLARRAAQHFGRPQDIEWAIDPEGQLWLLQSRPITTLAQMPDPDGALQIWDNSNIAESYGGITTPLTFSFARRAYESVYREFCRLMRVPEGAIARHDNTFRCMLGLVRGRIYYNLLNWYRVLALLPGFRVNRRFMEQMMGVREALPEDVVRSLQQSTFRDKLQDSLRLGNTLIGLVGNYVTLPRQIQRFYQRLDEALELPADTLSQWRTDELVDYYQTLEQKLLTRWDAPLVNDFFAMIFYGVLRKLTAAWCNDTAGTLQNDLISGEGGMISAEPAQRVRQLAALAAPHPDFVDTLMQGSLSQILKAIQQFPEFQAAYESYLDKFGDRCLEELKLESPTLHDDPLLLLRSVANLARYSKAEGRGQRAEGKASYPSTVRLSAHAEAYPPIHRSAERSRRSLSTPHTPHPTPHTPTLRQTAETHVHQTLRYRPLRRILFAWVLRNARNRVRDRENLRFERTRVFGRVRRIFVEIGHRLAAVDALDHPRDIFYLNLEEILGYTDGTTTCTDLKGLVAVRKAEFDRYHQMPSVGDRLTTHTPLHPLHPTPHPPHPQPHTPHPTSTHQGLGCCPGIVRAPVQVITDPKNAVLQPGHILVAERTDPGWILLFPAAVGLLVERGSLLSHSAIVSREMRIPAIVSIPGLTQWLQDGDWVEMDGSTGTIHRVVPQTDD